MRSQTYSTDDRVAHRTSGMAGTVLKVTDCPGGVDGQGCRQLLTVRWENGATARGVANQSVQPLNSSQEATMNEFEMLAKQGYPRDELLRMAGADVPGDHDCPDCGAPDFECMGEHEVYEAAAAHDEEVAAGLGDVYEHDDLPF